MNNTNQRSIEIERCPYLGLHDDSSTCLAYPSAWNYCYRAAPPASVAVSHQAETCLCRAYMDCKVYSASKWERLPSYLRGRVKAQLPLNNASRARRWFLLFLLLILLALLAVLAGQRFSSASQEDGGFSINLFSQLLARPNPVPSQEALAASDMTQAASSFSAGEGERPDESSSSTSTTSPSTGTASKAPETADPSSSPTLPLASAPEGTCGHALDAPFGEDIRFVIHRVAGGENLALYARQYETSTNAILAVNYHLPMPVWEDWIIVIPLETLDVSDVPPFEPYQAIGTSLSIDGLAEQLDTDPRTLAAYNAFDGACKTFSGWLLVPRKPIDS